MTKRNQLKLVEGVKWKDNIVQQGTYLQYESDAIDPARTYLKNVFKTGISDLSTSFEYASLDAQGIHLDTRYEPDPLMTYVYHQGQPVEIKERNGTTTSFIWGYNNTSPIVKATDTPFSTLNTAFGNLGPDIRTDPSLSLAHINTYTHDPVVGMQSVTDANGQSLSYEYDKLGRLVRIKDHDGNILEEYRYNYRIN